MSDKSKLILHQMEMGPMENYQYFVGDETTKEVAVVDPAWDIDALREYAKDMKFSIVMILLTHGHPDHANGVEELLSTHDVPIVISEKEFPLYIPQIGNLKKTKPNEIIKIGSIEIECLHTPGHTPGSQCFLVEGNLLTGDTLFIDGCGRCDLPGGNPKVMHNSLHQILMKLPGSTVIYPGHNYGPTPTATLGEQKKTNPYLINEDVEEFLSKRMGIL